MNKVETLMIRLSRVSQDKRSFPFGHEAAVLIVLHFALEVCKQHSHLQTQYIEHILVLAAIGDGESLHDGLCLASRRLHAFLGPQQSLGYC